MGNPLFQAFRRAGADLSRPLLRNRGGSQASYADMLAETGRYANLLAEMGIRPGDRVAVQVEKSASALFLYLACLRAGGVFLPLNTAYTYAELDYFLTDAEPGLVVCDPGREDQLAKAGIPVLTLGRDGSGSLSRRAQPQACAFTDAHRDADDLAAILYTSGTTGRSKGAMLTYGNLVSNAQTLADIWRFSKDDVLLHALPIYHSHGLFVAINTVMVSGASMIFLQHFDTELVLAAMADATAMMGVPTFYTRLLAEAALCRDTVEHMRLFVSGSAPLLAETHREWQERTGHAILERYGLTETNMNTSNPYDGERRPGSVGFPLPGVDLRITDPETGASLNQGNIGMIEVRGPNVCKGYWRNDEKTKAEFKDDGFFITGDLGMVDADGYVHIVGRAKDLVITGGFNVYPKEVEDEIDAVPGVLESAVFGVPHPDFGEGVTAAVVLKPGATLEACVILKAISPRLAKFKQPKQLFLLPELPRNTMGKVQKNLLRDRFAGIYAP